MHLPLAVWLSKHPWQAAILAACLGVLSLQGAILFVVPASAIPVLLTLERGSRIGGNVMLAVSAAMIGCLMWYQQPVWFAITYALVLFALPMMLADLLRRTSSLNLVFQLTLIAALVALALVYVLLPQPTAFWEQFLGRAFEALSQSGIQFDESLVPQLARTLWGAMVAVLLLTVLNSLFLARWWQSLIHSQGAFGFEFRRLSAGVILGVLLVVISIVALVTDLASVDSMAWVAMLGLALQGLAGAHRRKAEGRLPRGWLIVIYVMLMVPFFSFVTVALLAGWGLADFWRNMRNTSLQA